MDRETLDFLLCMGAAEEPELPQHKLSMDGWKRYSGTLKLCEDAISLTPVSERYNLKNGTRISANATMQVLRKLTCYSLLFILIRKGYNGVRMIAKEVANVGKRFKEKIVFLINTAHVLYWYALTLVAE